jgi:hypothetical protein
MVDENDVENSKKILEERLKREILAKLKAKIADDNKVNNVQYEILPIENIINYSDLKINTV